MVIQYFHETDFNHLVIDLISYNGAIKLKFYQLSTAILCKFDKKCFKKIDIVNIKFWKYTVFRRFYLIQFLISD